MEWSVENVLNLIELFHGHQILWDATHPEYKNRLKKKDAVSEIASILLCSSVDVERKLHNLKGQYYRERAKIDKSKTSGSSTDNILQSKWFAFKYLTFLTASCQPQKTTDTMEPNEEIQLLHEGDDCNISSISEVAHSSPVSSIQRRKVKQMSEDKRLEEAYTIMKEMERERNVKDDFSIFAENLQN